MKRYTLYILLAVVVSGILFATQNGWRYQYKSRTTSGTDRLIGCSYTHTTRERYDRLTGNVQEWRDGKWRLAK